ncbi:unnamed protein product [Hymenolepis diminuta]|uniref:Uncharacterized protein n=1 Tax=Hymenolepis diminuta TaxID=6216 RepID=A0A564YY76_HYMDI|nr:unnamed protein product [Hymenolepis diminuta]
MRRSSHITSKTTVLFLGKNSKMSTVNGHTELSFSAFPCGLPSAPISDNVQASTGYLDCGSTFKMLCGLQYNSSAYPKNWETPFREKPLKITSGFSKANMCREDASAEGKFRTYLISLN